MLTVEQVREALDYDPETGVFRWRKPSRRVDLLGKAAGCQNSWGYVTVSVGERKYMAHRLAWLYVHGRHPVGQIDHIDGNPSNNAISNLREATKAQNQGNRKKSKSNTTGFKGVTFNKRKNKFQAGIMVNRRHVGLGLYSTAEDAHQAYVRAAKHYFGEFARAG